MCPPSEWRLEIHDRLPSTSDLCREAAQSGAPELLAVMARTQTAGRGTRGRQWSTPPGNLALSVLLRPIERAREVGQWALLAGLAVAEALGAEPGGRLALKWPNDVLLDGAKLAGVLVEAEGDGNSGIAWLVIGIGVNLAHAPDIPGRETAALGGSIAPETLAERVLERLMAWRYQRGLGGFAAIRTGWMRLAQPLGTEMRVMLPSEVLRGWFAGLNEDGNLLLQMADGSVRPVIAGEVWTSHIAQQDYAAGEPGAC